jgi:UDP-2-acetamido-3-amino-2,3-dideoxy-glucuronate N-acetyltransferase
MQAPQPDYFAHPTAIVDAQARVGAGSKIWHFSHVMRDAVVGERCNIGQNVVISPGVTLGRGCKVQNNVSLYTGVSVEDDVFLGPSMVFTNVINPRAFIERKAEYRATLIRRGASIGANATIVCGVTLGEYCFVGAGAVVTRDVPPYATVYGNPARVRGFTCWCGAQLPAGPPPFATPHEVACGECGRRYRCQGEGILPIA